MRPGEADAFHVRLVLGTARRNVGLLRAELHAFVRIAGKAREHVGVLPERCNALHESPLEPVALRPHRIELFVSLKA